MAHDKRLWEGIDRKAFQLRVVFYFFLRLTMSACFCLFLAEQLNDVSFFISATTHIYLQFKVITPIFLFFFVYSDATGNNA